MSNEFDILIWEELNTKLKTYPNRYNCSPIFSVIIADYFLI